MTGRGGGRGGAPFHSFRKFAPLRTYIATDLSTLMWHCTHGHAPGGPLPPA